jgi:hypothetical protein
MRRLGVKRIVGLGSEQENFEYCNHEAVFHNKSLPLSGLGVAA